MSLELPLTEQVLAIERSIEHSSTNAQSHAGLWLLIDSSGVAASNPAKNLTSLGLQWRNVFENTSAREAYEVAPLLVSLNRAPAVRAALFKWLEQHARFGNCLLMLHSPAAEDQLVVALAARTEALLPDSMNVVFRFFDTRVFNAAMQILSAEQRAAFLGIAHTWWYADRDGVLQPHKSQYNTADKFGAPLELSAQQFAQFLDASLPDEVAMLLRQRAAADWHAFEQHGGGKRHAFLCEQIGRAQAAGIEAHGELALYCWLALKHGADFHRQPAWQKQLARVQAKETKLTEAVEQMNA